jgi:hypothetical protein
MPSKRFTLVELVILALLIGILVALLIGILALIASPNFKNAVLPTHAPTNAFPDFTASKHKAFMDSIKADLVASMKADLLTLAVAEDDYYRDSLKYSVTVVCGPTPEPGALTLCPSRGNLLEGMVLAGPGWGAKMTNQHVPGVVCVIYVNYPGAPPGTRDGTPICT